ncbi:MAG: DUF1178 family protein [Betaproteobacteria bacterium]
MKVVDLRCAHEHRFEGWFASEDELTGQLEQGRVECPLCGDNAVTRLPSAPRLNLAPAGREEPKQSVTQSPDLQTLWMQAVRQVLERTEDVGEDFPAEARRIHYGEAPERGIRGRASRAETEALREEGIEVMPLPLPPALKGPLQ